MNRLFAFSGPIGSGKSSVSKLFARKIGAKRNSFGSAVREIALERRLPTNREDLQELGAILVARERNSFCRRVVAPGFAGDSKALVIDGLRHLDILKELRDIVSPADVVCVYVDAPLSIRLERLRLRDGLSAAQIAELEKHSTEIEVEQHLKGTSNYVADNAGTADKCVEEILQWAHQYGPVT